jgi:hypothetical protein
MRAIIADGGKKKGVGTYGMENFVPTLKNVYPL